MMIALPNLWRPSLWFPPTEVETSGKIGRNSSGRRWRNSNGRVYRHNPDPCCCEEASSNPTCGDCSGGTAPGVDVLTVSFDIPICTGCYPDSYGIWVKFLPTDAHIVGTFDTSFNYLDPTGVGVGGVRRCEWQAHSADDFLPFEYHQNDTCTYLYYAYTCPIGIKITNDTEGTVRVVIYATTAASLYQYVWKTIFDGTATYTAPRDCSETLTINNTLTCGSGIIGDGGTVEVAFA